jgi:non-specific serine/threonine protein kinase/serine/threonine-protein kinase
MASQRELVKELFGAALDLKPEERAAFLDRECNGDPELRNELEALLAAQENLGSFLEHPIQESITADSPATATNVIGPYHLLELIGEGGMGQVWLAEQKQPVRRRVAIKLIKAGMDTREVVARFESERQALALMDHPAIAKVFDAGSTLDGRPYFVMEYVAGLPITDYCDRHRLTIRQRMELVIPVCEAVEHAHQKAIIHRDLKPSNILVSEIDGKPMPRIIDFGVAKATSQKLIAETMYTRIGAMVGTLGYMSPEQADPLTKDIDTRVDVYSLGAVLYELLTSTLPLDFRKLAYDEVLRRLLDQDVPRPSTKVTRLGGDSATAAKNRGSDPPTLIRQLRGDPDAIALKALEKDRDRRYASASELAADIGRYLRNAPVAAHPPSIAYRTRKFLRRNKLGVATAAVAILIIVLLVTWWRMPPAVAVVESVAQLTDDGQPKDALVSDGSRIYFMEGEPGSHKIAQVSVTGGPITTVETGFEDAELNGIARDGSGLLVRARNDFLAYNDQPFWWIPLPAGEPRRFGILEGAGADILPDGRIVFAKFVQPTEKTGTVGRTQWFIADKDGSNPRALVSFPGLPGGVWVSRNGRRVLLTQELTGDRRLFEIAQDRTGLREIRKLNDDEDGFIWTQDEKYLLYQSGSVRQSDIWLLPMQIGPFGHPGKPIRLTNGPLPYSEPYPSPDGKQIYVLGTKLRGELVRYDMQSHEFTPILSGISASDPTFSRDGKWVAYESYPDHTLWRSQSDGTERKQLTIAPMILLCSCISADGTKVAFTTDKNELSVISTEGGQSQKIDGQALCAAWSPDGNYLYYQTPPTGAGAVIADLRTGNKSAVPSSAHLFGAWLTQDTLIAWDPGAANKPFQTFDLKTQKWADFTSSGLSETILDYMPSPDQKYLYFATGGAEQKIIRIRLSDQQFETVTNLKDFHRAVNVFTQINVAPDGSPIFTRDTGYQEIYALKIRWP